MSESLFSEPAIIYTERCDVSTVEQAKLVFSALAEMPIRQRVDTINAIRRELHKLSPFATEPVDCIQWVPADCVSANDYNTKLEARM